MTPTPSDPASPAASLPVATVKRGPNTPWGHATILLRWEGGEPLLSVGEHQVYAESQLPALREQVSLLEMRCENLRAEGMLALKASKAAPLALHRDQIIELISGVSNNSADHDIAFAYRVLDAANGIPGPAGEAAKGEKS